MNNKKILIVDDSKFICSVVEGELIKNGRKESNIFVANSLAEAQELVFEHDFHVAILDINLPDAHDGEVVDLLLEEDVPSVVLTAGLNETSKKIILSKNIVDYITKSNPQSISYLVDIINRILNNYDAYVLIVDDSKTARMLMRVSLEKLKLNVLEASSAKEAIDIIKNSDKVISLVLTDYEMPDMNGMELTMNLRHCYSKDKLAIIAISASEDIEVSTSFLRHGANDYIRKPFTNGQLSVRINANLELIDLFKQTKENANKDFLTGMFNRRYFFENGNPITSKAKRKKLPIAVAMLDIDFFKKINDTYGHDIGDIAIKEVAHILNDNLRDSDLAARFGGEEFCILLDDISEDDLREKFEIIRDKFENNTIKSNSKSFSYTVSIGIYYGVLLSLEDAIKSSDEALYEAKETGRNKVVIIKD